MLEELVKIAKLWFEENNVKCPIYAKDWVQVGVLVPPRMGRAALKSKGFKPADIINAIYKTNIAQTNSKVDINYKELGLELISKYRMATNHYNITYKCTSCGREHTTDYGTISRMATRGDKYCYKCRGVGGSYKELEHYEYIIPEHYTLLSRDNKHVQVRHDICSTEFTRSISGIKYRETESICCPTCDSTVIYGKSVGNYASMIEKEITEYMLEICTEEIEVQVLYSKFLDTYRKFRADIFVPKFNTVIEITSKNNSLEKYNKRMLEKQTLAETNGLIFYKVTSKQQIEDIVRTFRETLKS